MHIRGHNAITGYRNNYKLKNALRFLSLATALYSGERLFYRCFIFSKILRHIGQILPRLLTQTYIISLKFLSLLFLQVLTL